MPMSTEGRGILALLALAINLRLVQGDPASLSGFSFLILLHLAGEVRIILLVEDHSGRTPTAGPRRRGYLGRCSSPRR
jgi:hypothetical protein